jgi:hypothetical protein
LIAIVEIALLQYPVDSSLGPLAAPNITRRYVFNISEDERIGVDSVLQHVHLKARVPLISNVECSASSSPSTNAISASAQTIPSAPTTMIADTVGSLSPRFYDPPKSDYRASVSLYIPTTSDPNSPNTASSTYVPTTPLVSVVTTIALPNGHSGDIPTFTTTSVPYVPTQPPPSDSVAGLSYEEQTLSAGLGTYASASPANAAVGSQLANVPTSIIIGPNIMATSLVPVATHTSGGMTMVVLGSPSSAPLVPVSTYTSNGVALVAIGSPSEASVVPVSTYTSNGSAFVVMGTPSEASQVPVSTMTSNGVAVVIIGPSTSQFITSAALSSGSSVVVEPVTSTSGSVAYVYMTTMTLGPSQSQTSTATAPQNTSSTTSDQQTTIAFTNMSYFAAWYLPTIIAVAFRVLWTIVYNNARMMEPFYRLASPAGVTGGHALDNL